MMNRSATRAAAQVSRRRQVPKAARRKSSPAKKGAGSRGGRTRLSAKATTDHEQIRRWVESRGGHPAIVKRTAKGKPESGVIRIDFPGFSGAQSLKAIPWEEWFDIFEQRHLAFLRQERTATGKPSRFNKLVARE
ncbi:MAG TPA: hypothetical protein VHI52_15075 [Verrucomicrobiae bacterium]|nr:hypothetical protein [Verrucomicrobiae bacterium]